MTPLRLILLVLLATAALTAVALARRVPEHRPVAAYLTAVLLLDIARLGLGQLLPAGEAVRTGVELVWRHLDQAAYLAMPFSMAAMGVAMWRRR